MLQMAVAFTVDEQKEEIHRFSSIYIHIHIYMNEWMCSKIKLRDFLHLYLRICLSQYDEGFFHLQTNKS